MPSLPPIGAPPAFELEDAELLDDEDEELDDEDEALDDEAPSFPFVDAGRSFEDPSQLDKTIVMTISAKVFNHLISIPSCSLRCSDHWILMQR